MRTPNAPFRRSTDDCLNGITDDGWTEYAKETGFASSRVLELNIFYIPAEITITGREVEERYVRIVRRVKQAVGIPVAVKLSPFFSSMGEMAKQLVEIGADGLVLFNRFYQPDFNQGAAATPLASAAHV